MYYCTSYKLLTMRCWIFLWNFDMFGVHTTCEPCSPSTCTAQRFLPKKIGCSALAITCPASTWARFILKDPRVVKVMSTCGNQLAILARLGTPRI